VLVDARRVEDAFATISYFETASDVPFIVAVNMFDGELLHELDEVREALALSPDVPLTTCDAHDPGSTAQALQELVSYTMHVGVSDHTSPPKPPA
jgi:signal recognition particle receptor subunit beta